MAKKEFLIKALILSILKMLTKKCQKICIFQNVWVDTPPLGELCMYLIVNCPRNLRKSRGCWGSKKILTKMIWTWGCGGIVYINNFSIFWLFWSITWKTDSLLKFRFHFEFLGQFASRCMYHLKNVCNIEIAHKCLSYDKF